MANTLFALIAGLFAGFVLSATQGLVYAYQPIPYEYLSFLDNYSGINKTSAYALLNYLIACSVTLGIAGGLVGIQVKGKLIYFSSLTSIGALIIFLGARMRFVYNYTWENIFPYGWQHGVEVAIIISVISLSIYTAYKIKNYFV